MTTPRTRQQLIELWLMANDGAASAEQLDQLSRWIADDAEARALVVELAGQQGWLAWNAADLRPAEVMTALSESVEKTDFRRHRRTFSRLAAAVRRVQGKLASWAASPRVAWSCALAIAVAGAWLIGRQAGNDELALVDLAAGGQPIRATMISSTGCVWGPGNTLKQLADERFASGDSLQLLEGLAEFALKLGPTRVGLQLEGPASAVLTGEGTPSVSYGKFVVTTSGRQADGYPIETSFGRVLVEQSAEVGLIVFGSSAEIHCFRGRAVIESPWLRSSGEEQPSVAIVAGESLVFDDVGGATLEGRRGSADKAQFTPQVSMSTDFLSVSPEYVQEVKGAKPVAYWRFEDESRGTARNEMSDSYHCEVRGDVAHVGPPGNRALELGFAAEPGSVVAMDSWDKVLGGSFSLEVWVKPNHYHLGSIVGFVGDFDAESQRNKHGVLVEACGPAGPSDWLRPNQLRFLHRAQLTTNPSDGVSVFSGRSYEARRWQHVAAVRDGSQLRLYLDGQLVQSGHEENPTPRGLHLVIGQLYTESVERFFIGQLDEAAIYDRPLTEREVWRHHELLRPQGEDYKPSI